MRFSGQDGLKGVSGPPRTRTPHGSGFRVVVLRAEVQGRPYLWAEGWRFRNQRHVGFVERRCEDVEIIHHNTYSYCLACR